MCSDFISAHRSPDRLYAFRRSYRATTVSVVLFYCFQPGRFEGFDFLLRRFVCLLVWYCFLGIVTALTL